MATYGDVVGVEALVPEIGLMDSGTTPTSVQVEAWLAEAYAKINRAIANAGYSTPVSSSAALYPELTGLENLYGAAFALRARGIDTASGETETVSDRWLAEFREALTDLAASNLALLGATPLPSTTTTRRRRLRTLQMRRIDGYSRGAVTETYEPRGGEYSGETSPSE